MSFPSLISFCGICYCFGFAKLVGNYELGGNLDNEDQKGALIYEERSLDNDHFVNLDNLDFLTILTMVSQEKKSNKLKIYGFHLTL